MTHEVEATRPSKEVAKARRDAEDEIIVAIATFHHRTGMYVHSINVVNVFQYGSDWTLASVHIEARMADRVGS